MPFVRSSKFRHVFGQPAKRDNTYESISISRNTVDNPFCAVNPKFVAIITESSGGGSFIILPLEQYGRVDMNHPKVCGHKNAVLDIQWCPHNDNVIASASEDTMIKVWHIPDGGLTDSITEAEQTLAYHQKKVLQIQWHPVAENVMLSIGAEGWLLIWDVLTGELLQEITCHPDLIYSASWNPIGSLIGTTCKDKKIRIIDARTGEIKQEAPGFEGAKPARIQLINGDRAFLTGFARGSRRLYGIRDVNKLEPALAADVEIDSGNGSLMIFYDGDLNMVYLSAKGDGKLLYYEITDSAPYVHYLNHYQSSDPSRGLGFMPKRGLRVNDHEVARFYKLHQKGICEPIPMIVPRKSDLFQDDIYPPCVSLEPALTCEEWVSGKNAEPKRLDMETLYSGGTAAPTAKKSSKLGRAQPKADGAANATPAPTPAPAPVTSSALKKTPTPSSTSAPASQESKESTPSSPSTEPAPAPVPAPAPIEEEKLQPKPIEVKSEREVSNLPHDKIEPTSTSVKENITPPPNKPDKLVKTLSEGKTKADSQNLVDINNLLNDIKLLRSSVNHHGERIVYLENLSSEQKKQIEELLKEVAELKSTVQAQEVRIAKLEAQASSQQNGE